MSERRQDFCLGLTGRLDAAFRLAISLPYSQGLMQFPHVFHDIGSRSIDSDCRQSQFDPAQIRHGSDASEKMASYLAVRPVTHGAYSNEIVILAQTEAILHLPAIKTCLYDISHRPVRVVCDNDILPEHGLPALDQISVFTETHGKTVGGMLECKLVKV